MLLYCFPHNKTHDIDGPNVERIVYAMTAALADAETEAEQDRLYVGDDAFNRFSCPLAHLEMADNPEGYREHVDASLGGRGDRP